MPNYGGDDTQKGNQVKGGLQLFYQQNCKIPSSDEQFKNEGQREQNCFNHLL